MSYDEQPNWFCDELIAFEHHDYLTLPRGTSALHLPLKEHRLAQRHNAGNDA